MIPSYDSFGKMQVHTILPISIHSVSITPAHLLWEQWEAVDAALKNFVASEAIATNEEYSPEYLISSTKYNLSWKQRLEELSQEVDQLNARCQEMEEVSSAAGAALCRAPRSYVKLFVVGGVEWSSLL